MERVPIYQFMSHDVVTVPLGTCLTDAIKVMTQAGVSYTVIVDGDCPSGIISQKDLSSLCMQLLSKQPSRSFDKIMADDFFTLSVDADTSEAFQTMQQHRSGQLVIVDNENRLCGMLTQTDLLRAKVSLIEAQKLSLERRVVERTQELRKSNKKLRNLSRIDPMLNIGNRRAMNDELAKVSERAKRYHRPYAVALLDIDHFKKFNDFYGHQRGDEALIRVAHTVKKTIRAADTVYRYGGEEFLVLLPEVDAKGAAIAAENMRQAIEELNCEHKQSPLGHLSVSIGIAEQNIDSPCNIEVISTADNALYYAKHKGRNRVEVFNGEVILQPGNDQAA